jgi:hypothetical protein
MPASVFTREFVTSAKGRYKCRVMDANGNKVFEHGKWLPNLILDSGLDKVAYMPWAQCFQFCRSGTGTTATKVTTASNASQTGTTVSITAGSFSFTSGHVGKLIYWPGTDTSAKITAFTNTTTVTVDRSQSVSAAAFDLYNVDQTSLTTPYSMNMRYQIGEGMCGTDIDGDTVTMFRTFDFYIEGSPIQITELGFSDAPKSSTLFSRVLLPDPIFLSAGQWLQVSYQLSIKLSPATPNGKSPTVSGWPVAPAVSTSGNEQIQLYGLCIVDANGVSKPYDRSQLCNEPYSPGSNYLGPQFGYTNRWGNGAGSPTKLYAKGAANPFTNPRNTPAKLQVAVTGSYFPLASALGSMQWSGNSTTLAYTNSVGQNDYVFTAADIGSVIKVTSTLFARITARNSSRSITISVANPNDNDVNVSPTLYFRSGNGSTGQWGAEIENVADMMQPLVDPPTPPQVVHVAGTIPGWNGVDPQTTFPNAVPYSGESAWGNWTVDFSPTSSTPTTLTLTANPQNWVSPTYQWQAFNEDTSTWVNVDGATASTLQVSPSQIFDLDDPTVFGASVQFRVILDGSNPDTVRGAVGYYTINAFRQNPAQPTYYVVLSNPRPAVRRTGTTVISGDSGSSGRVKTEIHVYRDTTELSVVAYSSSTFPGVGKFSFTESDPTIQTTSNLVFFASGANITSGPTLTYTISIKIETSTLQTVNWLVDVLTPATASTPIVDVTASDRVFLIGGGTQDVTGGSAFISEAADSPATIGTCVDRSTSRQVELPLILQSYTPGAFSRIKQATFQTNMANGTNWRTIGIGGMDPDTQIANRVNASKYNGYVFVFDEAQTKLKTNYLTVNFQYTWNRDLSS